MLHSFHVVLCRETLVLQERRPMVGDKSQGHGVLPSRETVASG